MKHIIPSYIVGKINISTLDEKILIHGLDWSLNNNKKIQQIINSYRNINKVVFIFWITDNYFKFTIPENVRLYTTSLYKSVLQKNEYLLPYVWEDKRFFSPLARTEKPIVGFCGLISSYRIKTINLVKNNKNIISNFILRNKFWGGKPHDNKIISDFEENMKSSHFNICNRGAGNYSMRFYQTLSCGRIPILLDTDMILPFENVINWNDIIVIANNEEELINKLFDYWNNKDISEMQAKCRQIYEEYFLETKFFDKILNC